MIKKSIAFLSCLLFLSSCSNSSSGDDLGTFSDLGTSKFIIGFSNIIEPGSQIALYNEQGEQLEDLEFPGFDLLNSVQTKHAFYIAGHRGYQHAKIDRASGDLSVLQHPEKVDGYGGAYQMNESNGYLFYDVNMGATEDSNGKYISYFVFGEEQDEKKITELEGTIHDAILIGDHFYVYTESENISGDDDENIEFVHNFYLIDKESGEVTNRIELPIEEDMFPTNTTNEMYTLFGDHIIIALSDNVNQAKDNQLVSFNIESEETEVVKTFPKSFRPVAMVPYEENLIIIGETGEVKTLDSEFNEVDEYTLDADFSRVMDLSVNQDQVSVLVYTDTSKEFQGEITTFQLIDGQKLNAVPITHDTDFEQAELIVVE